MIAGWKYLPIRFEESMSLIMAELFRQLFVKPVRPGHNETRNTLLNIMNADARPNPLCRSDNDVNASEGGFGNLYC